MNKLLFVVFITTIIVIFTTGCNEPKTIIPHYVTTAELQCHCGCVMPKSIKKNLENILEPRLDSTRYECGFPFIVNSGYRCKSYDQSIGGKGEHRIGAADIKLKNAVEKFKVIKYGSRHFNRLEIGTKGFESWVHCGVGDIIDPDKFPTEVFWTYQD